ncbi:MAG: metallophosphoesterase [Armatimonadetes bacterium]|nr:metallophosphoesterase [Armatimonadota bacterium]
MTPVPSSHLVPLEALPAALDGFRVVHLTDFHLGRRFGLPELKPALTIADALRPTLVAVTGDFVQDRTLHCLPPVAARLAELDAPLGVWATLGNHDHWEGGPEVLAILRAAGLRTLVDECAEVLPGLWLVGLDDLMAGRPDVGAATRGVPEGAAVVVLSHNPGMLPRIAARPWLMLSGHTHGGQVALPGLGPRGTMAIPPWALATWLGEAGAVLTRGANVAGVTIARYPAGWYADGRARLYVNRGLGMGDTLPLRWNCPPEIACFTLAPAPAPTGRGRG